MAGPREESPHERFLRYRSLAHEAQELAARADSSDLRQAYVALSQGWAALADDLGKAIRRSQQH
jgi:hypothetical protein